MNAGLAGSQALLYSKVAPSLAFAHTYPQAPDRMGDAGKIHVHKNIFLHDCFLALLSWPTDSLGQTLLFKPEAHGVIPGVSQFGEPIGHA